jgi:flagellar basal-body rod modification protein FlgD
MTTIASTTAASGTTGAAKNGTPGAAVTIAKANEDAGDRFLKLLMTQVQNQDPLNPMDNAQMTTPMAQINTVAGIEKLNDSMTKMVAGLSKLDTSASLTGLQTALQGSLQGLATQMRQSQALQGAALVGREVWTGGDALPVRDGVARGSFDLKGPADAVTVEVLAPSGHMLQRIDLGARASGRVEFSWAAPEGTSAEGLKYRISATSGAANVPADLYAGDVVTAVSTTPEGLVLQLARGGATPLERIKAFN